MTNDHRRLDAQTVQEILLDDPDFLHEIVERVLQELFEAEMSEHIGAAPHERTNARKGYRNGYKPRTLRTRVGTWCEPHFPDSAHSQLPAFRACSASNSTGGRYSRLECNLFLL